MKTAVVTVALLAIPRLALACPVCFGNANSAQTKAVQAGILALLVVTVVMLASIAGFFFIYLRRRIRIVEESNGGELLDA
jgi:predicted transporter